jgi:hypothetical protein
VATGIACLVVLGISVARKRAGVRGRRDEHDRRSARVAAMTGIERTGGGRVDATAGITPGGGAASSTARRGGKGVPHAKGGGRGWGPGRGGGAASITEFDPRLDLVPAAFGTVGLVAAAIDTDGQVPLALLRTLVGAAFLGAITDAMLLGHWYLVQPGLPRRRLNELVDAVAVIWPIEVIALLIPTGMVSVWSGGIDDGWGGMLGWMWAACAVTTIGLVLVTKAALRERQYSAVMAATGLLYLAILTALGTDIVARAVLSP